MHGVWYVESTHTHTLSLPTSSRSLTQNLRGGICEEVLAILSHCRATKNGTEGPNWCDRNAKFVLDEIEVRGNEGTLVI